MIFVGLSGCCSEKNCYSKKSTTPYTAKRSPRFRNGDIVVHRLDREIKGIVIQNDYIYDKEIGAWCCAVDVKRRGYFFNLNFLPYEVIEKRYFYEHELDLWKSISAVTSIRWNDKCFLNID